MNSAYLGQQAVDENIGQEEMQKILDNKLVQNKFGFFQGDVPMHIRPNQLNNLPSGDIASIKNFSTKFN